MRYDDLDDLTRCNLTDEQFGAHCKREMMEAGVIAPIPPSYEPVEDITVLTKTVNIITYAGEYRESRLPLHFDTCEQAMEVAAAIRGGYYTSSEYKIGKEIEHKVADVKIGVAQVYQESDVARVRALLIANKEAKDNNSELRSEYSKAVDAQEKILASLRTDRYALQTKMARYRRMLEVWNDYLTTCDDDKGVALKFLCKAYSIEEIKEMCRWLSLESLLEMCSDMERSVSSDQTVDA